MILEFSDQKPTEPRDKLPVKRSMIPSNASEEIDLTNNAAKQNLSKQSAQTPTQSLVTSCLYTEEPDPIRCLRRD
ncbi:hypothetical protein DPMN_027411 [Dreissena polymorpha]|uniref:Uncharacterized protein n=1 Tax=Dreissena polymorpha TaxID=45954 RepID=A0A9D4LV51_DREPO|nr:hypothetical protein DPMN_027411 [Dreissena polymorpha]